jgi:hypothetical protein
MDEKEGIQSVMGEMANAKKKKDRFENGRPELQVALLFDHIINRLRERSWYCQGRVACLKAKPQILPVFFVRLVNTFVN